MKEWKVEIVASSESEFEIQKSKFGKGYKDIILAKHPWESMNKYIFSQVIILTHWNLKVCIRMQLRKK